MSTFSGLTNALRSLGAQQYALSVTSDNMANANTPGYTRKVADIQEVGPTGGVPRMFSTPGSYEGTSAANSASRQNDLVLDYRNRVEQGLNTYAQAKQTTLTGVETVFNEPSDTGLSEQLNKFWSSWSNLANNDPADSSARNDVLKSAGTIAATLNAASVEVGNLATSANRDLAQTVSSVNAAATQVATLNRQIKVGTASGTDVNSLQDQRDVLLGQLANLSGATSTLQADGTVTVALPPASGSTAVDLVVGDVTSTMATAGASPSLSVTVGGTAVGSTTGQLQGDLDALNTILPLYKSSLDGIAAQLASNVNAQQVAGYDATGAAATSAPFFSVTSGNEAATIAVALTSRTQIAASGVATPVTLPVTPPNKDGSNARAIAALGASTTGADALYRTMINTLGRTSQQATQAASVQQAVTTSVSNLQQSASGVNYDEETTNILVFQRAYQASSRVLTTVDEMLDQLINHTGRVGL